MQPIYLLLLMPAKSNNCRTWVIGSRKARQHTPHHPSSRNTKPIPTTTVRSRPINQTARPPLPAARSSKTSGPTEERASLVINHRTVGDLALTPPLNASQPIPTIHYSDW